MASNYIVGTEILLSVAFLNNSGTPLDPTAITLQVKKEGGIATTYVYGVEATLYKGGTGVYYKGYTPSTGGVYYYRWAGTGALVAASEGSFFVQSGNF
jgi:hypothetical protein